MSANAGDTSGKYVTGVAGHERRDQITYGDEANAQIAAKTLEIVPYVSRDNSVMWRLRWSACPGRATTA